MNVNPGHRYNALEDREFLQKLGVLIDNKVTYGGLLVFGTEDILTSAMTHYKVEYLEIPGTSYEDASTRHSFRISSEQNLFLTFFEIYERLQVVQKHYSKRRHSALKYCTPEEKYKLQH